jgi:hypothetical protein
VTETFLHGCGGDPACRVCHPETPPLFPPRLRPVCGDADCARCYPGRSDLERAFLTFDSDNPEIWSLFVRFAFQAFRAGHRHFSSDAVVHRIRWETSVEPRGEQPGPTDLPRGGVKISNNWTPYYARKFLRSHAGSVPEDFFTLRPVKGGST